MIEAVQIARGSIAAPAASIAIRILDMDDARNTGLRGPSARIAGKSHGSGGRSMIGTIAGDNFVPASEQPRDLDSVLVGVRAAQGKKRSVEISRGQLGESFMQYRTRFSGYERRDVGQV